MHPDGKARNCPDITWVLHSCFGDPDPDPDAIVRLRGSDVLAGRRSWLVGQASLPTHGIETVKNLHDSKDGTQTMMVAHFSMLLAVCLA